jgi:hypothetical protein
MPLFEFETNPSTWPPPKVPTRKMPSRTVNDFMSLFTKIPLVDVLLLRAPPEVVEQKDPLSKNTHFIDKDAWRCDVNWQTKILVSTKLDTSKKSLYKNFFKSYLEG